MRATRKKLALVIGQLGFGGGEGQLFELARGLVEQGEFEPRVYCLSNRTLPYGQRLRQLGIDVTKISAAADPWKVLSLAHHLRADPPDLVHSFLYIANRYSMAATRLAGKPVLITSARNCKRDPGLLRMLNQAAFRASDAIVCNSSTVGKYITRVYKAPASKIQVIYNGIDVARFCPKRTGSHLSNGHPPVIGTVGRIEAQKNHCLFLEAAAELQRRIGICRFVIAGNGSQLAAAKRKAAGLGLEGAVEFLGSRSDVPELVRGLDVFWLTSSWEGTPNAVLEAMASGVPVVATDVGACAEIIDNNRTGCLVQPRDPDQIVERTEFLLRNRKRASAIAEEGRREVGRRFSLSTMVNAVSDLYRKLLADGV